MEPERKWLLIGSLIAVVLQVVLAPNISVGNAMPNFIVVFVVVYAVLRGEEQHYVLAFVMGLVSDLLGDGPVGATSMCLLIAVFVLSFIVQAIGNDNLVMTLIVLFLVILGIDVIYAIFLVSSGAATFVDGMVYRAVPCAVYDAVLAMILYVVLMRLMGGSSTGSMGGSRPSTVRKNPAPTPNLRFH